MRPGQRELWRVGNLAADTILELQVVFDGVRQPLEVVGLDGVPTGSQDGTQQGKLVRANHLRLPPASRAEFIVTGPADSVQHAVFQTTQIATGPNGDNDTQRTLATIQTVDADAETNDARLSAVRRAPWAQRFEGLATAPVSASRRLYFSENATQTEFFITVDGQTPTVFDVNNPPAVVTTQGSVEEWTIENRAQENHEFHFHQLHFLVQSQDHFEVNGSLPVATIQGQLMDMIEIPFWDGDPNHPYPSVRVRIDFRGPDVGDFVYHCHILNHEDQGMMAIIRVLPAK